MPAKINRKTLAGYRHAIKAGEVDLESERISQQTKLFTSLPSVSNTPSSSGFLVVKW